jgi:hypothetical protein
VAPGGVDQAGTQALVELPPWVAKRGRLDAVAAIAQQPDRVRQRTQQLHRRQVPRARARRRPAPTAEAAGITTLDPGAAGTSHSPGITRATGRTHGAGASDDARVTRAAGIIRAT